ncbi:MAG: malate dehydrogenase [Gemmatimonadota bacterium]|nr:malate dehydrogenase [Gemmatimonadota bacterium]MDH3427883.1 malate dehydrogenase [Gemmatimonadota bacterium]
MNKITVVGAGHVGATTAQRIAERELANRVVLVDILEGVPQGKALDQWESAPVEGFDTVVTGAQDYESTTGSGIYVVTAGLARKPGMSRDDLVLKNAKIIESVAREIAIHSPDAIIVMVTNPLDVMAWVAMQTTGFPRERVIGMAGVLDTARFRSFIALELGVSVEDVQALVLGGHGDSMVPLVSTVSVGGIPLTQMLAADRIEELVERTRKGGGEIVKLLGTGSAFYAPSAAAVQMVESIVRDKKRILPAAAWLEGEFGLEGMFLGVPCKLGRSGLEGIIEVDLTDAEQAALEASASEVRKTMEVLGG